ncbi:MAG: TlpA family protein disulfide reductase [Gemmataceae bacterium]
MVATLCFLGGLLAPAQVPALQQGPVPYLLTPRLARAQELVYRGSYAEETTGNGVRNSRSYDLDTRLLVLDVNDTGADVAFLTTLKLQRKKGALDTPDPGSVRLELARLDPQGRLTSPAGTSLLASLTGPSTIDCDAVIEVPRHRVAIDQGWEVAESGRPPHSWMVVGTENVAGTLCIKLAGLQQSADWSRPRADHTAWRRTDLVWLSPKLGVAVKVERTIERREPARQEPTQRFSARYELESGLVYPRQLLEDRLRDINQYTALARLAAPVLGQVGKARADAVDPLLMKIKLHTDGQPATPYRPALDQLRRQLEASKRGELAFVPENAGPKPVSVATVGRPAPDFIVPNLIREGEHAEMVRLHRLLGKPTLLLFYSPDSRFVHEILRFAQKIHDGKSVQVLALAFSDERDVVVKQYNEMSLTVPLLAGKGLRHTYGVEATPRLVVIDGDGVVRGTFTGWGPEIPGSVLAELERWLRR